MKIVRRVYHGLRGKNIVTLAASISFFGFMSLFPFLILVATITSFFVERELAILQVQRLLFPFPISVSHVIFETVARVLKSGKTASLLSLAALAYSSVSVFSQLASALHNILGTKHKLKGWLVTVKTFVVFLASTLILFFLMIGGTTLFVLADRLGVRGLFRSLWFTETGTVLVMALGFALSYRFLAFRKIRWKSVFIGGAVTAVVWEALKILFGLYVNSISGFSSLYGAIGTIFFLMLWLFDAVLIYLIGAQVSVDL